MTTAANTDEAGIQTYIPPSRDLRAVPNFTFTDVEYYDPIHQAKPTLVNDSSIRQKNK